MYTRRTPKTDVLDTVQSFTHQGVGVTRQTIAASLSVPINEVTHPVLSLIRHGLIVEDGSVHGPTGRQRKLLWLKDGVELAREANA